jgi:DNA-directed RNA polymerase subunit M/transcription elongation factor TFIIS
MEFFHCNIGISIKNTPPLDIKFYKEKKYNITRLQKLRIFSEYFNNHVKFSEANNDLKNLVIKKVESACFNLTIKKSQENNIPNSWDYEEFEELYHIICGKPLAYIDSSIDSDKANNIILIILSDPKKAKWMASINHREIYPKEYEELEHRQNADDQVIKKFCTLYQCPKCKKSLCTLKNRYNRSLDEGVNLTAMCAWCHTEWNC